MDAGAGAIPMHGAPLPEATLASIRANRVCLKGPLATPIGGGYRSVNVALRQEFDLYANVRPARTFAGLPHALRRTSISWSCARTPRACTRASSTTSIPTQAAPPSRSRSSRASARERIIRFAFEYARAQRPQEGDAGSQGQHPQVDHRASSSRSGARSRKRTRTSSSTTSSSTTARCSWCAIPTRFDVIVTTNLFGDILSAI